MLAFITQIILIAGILPFLEKEGMKPQLTFKNVVGLILFPSLLVFIISFIVYAMQASQLLVLGSTVFYFIIPFAMLKLIHSCPTSRALLYSSVIFAVVFLTKLSFELGNYALKNV